jgi:gamma-glutamyltranspeptidase/glutathione hydrolase
MGVVWPHMNGVGGDLFAQVWSAADTSLYGLNASGRSGKAMTLQSYRERGLDAVPQHGPLSITVPGAVDGWWTLHGRWGKLEPARLFRDAIHLARHGFRVTQRLTDAATSMADALRAHGVAAEVYMPQGRPPREGELLVQSDLAGTLERLSHKGPDDFYRGELAERIVRGIREAGCLLDTDDFASHRSDWVEPLRVPYRGAEVTELPPNGQGIALLQMLQMLEAVPLAQMGFGSAEAIHQMVERKKLAFADRATYVADPSIVDVPIARLLDPSYARLRSEQVGPHAAGSVEPGPIGAGDTIYLCAADRDGNMISLIQSLYNPFGSKVMAPGTGVLLQNRGLGFKLVDGHLNVLAPNKRPMHTLMPGFALKGGKPWMAFGTRGADGQPQTGLQLVTDLLDFGMEPQQAQEAPRWVHGAPSAAWPRDGIVLEGRLGADVAADLASRGHKVFLTSDLDDVMGTAQVIVADDERGCYVGASDPRGDGAALPI